MNLGALFGNSTDEDDDGAGVKPAAASPLARDDGPQMSYASGLQPNVADSYGAYLDKFKTQQAPQQRYAQRPAAAPPRFGGGFQRGFGQAQQMMGQAPQYGTAPQPQQVSAFQRFRGMYG